MEHRAGGTKDSLHRLQLVAKRWISSQRDISAVFFGSRGAGTTKPSASVLKRLQDTLIVF